jgi:hypothetical protein
MSVVDRTRTAASARSGATAGASAKVIPLRPGYDRRGKYPQLRAFIDTGRDVEVTFEAAL